MKLLSSICLSLIILAFSLAYAGNEAGGGGSPFLYSGSLLQTIFSNPMVWQKVHGSIEKIQRIDQNQKSSTFQISTSESVAVKNAQGSIVRWDQQPCQAVITVTNVSTDVFVTKLEVTRVDFSQCPSAQN